MSNELYKSTNTTKDERIAELEAALAGMLMKYIRLVNCGDCGNWNPEEEKEVIRSREALGK